MAKEYYIKLDDGQTVPVSEEVYRAYMRPKWRETKQRAVQKEKEFSFEYMEENGMEHMCNQEKKLVEQIVEDKLLLEMLLDALETLTVDERLLIDELFFNGKSERKISSETNIPRKTIAYRKNIILNKLKKIIEKI